MQQCGAGRGAATVEVSTNLGVPFVLALISERAAKRDDYKFFGFLFAVWALIFLQVQFGRSCWISTPMPSAAPESCPTYINYKNALSRGVPAVQ